MGQDVFGTWVGQSVESVSVYRLVTHFLFEYLGCFVISFCIGSTEKSVCQRGPNNFHAMVTICRLKMLTWLPGERHSLPLSGLVPMSRTVTSVWDSFTLCPPHHNTLQVSHHTVADMFDKKLPVEIFGKVAS